MFMEICPQNSTKHVIADGDTIWKLSQAYGVDMQSIFDVNPGIDPQNLQIGSTLCIPAVKAAPPMKTAPMTTPAAPSVACPKGTFRYTVRSGDTIWMLSQIYDVDMQSIFDANPGIDPQNLQIGSTLCIPSAKAATAPPVKAAPPAKTVPQAQPAPPMKTAPMVPAAPPVACPKGTFRYTVRSGDTIWMLSQIYDVDMQSIFDANPGIDPQNLQIGSTLCIPSAKAAPAPPVKAAPPAKTAPPAPVAPLIPTVPQTEKAVPRRFAYCIKKCDTICGIARTFYVSVKSIINENPGINPKCLQAGTYLYVPVNCCGENTWRYTVMAGDTLNRIANKLNVCPSEIVEANPNIDFQHLIHCQVLCIPKE